MRQFMDILRFELAFRRRHAPLWIFTAICFAFSFLAMAIRDGMNIFGGAGAVAINSPAALQVMMLVFCLLLGLVITTAFVASAVNRDHEYGVQGLFFSTPLRKGPYLLGRFCGSMFAAWFMISGLALGALIASVMPWHDAERVVPLTLTPYVYSLGVFLFPNLLLIGAISFAVATLTRRLMFAYVALLGLLVIYIVSGNYISDLDNDFFAAVSDPFGLRTYSYARRYWTPAELNTIAAPFTPEILINRAIWSSVALSVLGFTLWRYKMVLPSGGGKRVEPEPAAAPERASLPTTPVQLRHDWRGQLVALLVQSKVEILALVRGVAFRVILLFAIGNLVGVAGGMLERRGTTTLPVTHLMLSVIEGGMGLFMLIVLVFYAGELIHRERKHRVNELFDTLPIPNWVPLVAKITAMLAGMAVMLFIAALTTMIFQLTKGYTYLEVGLYLRELVLFQAHAWVMLCVAAIVVQVLVNQKFIGYAGVAVLILVVPPALMELDFEHNLYNFASYPGVVYSDMNGYGHFVLGTIAFTIYWSAVAVLLVLIAELFWVRGTDNPMKLRMRAARARLTRGRAGLIIAASLVWLGSGGYIFYNTTILNRYVTSDEQEALQVRYERDYKQYEGLAQPRITAVDVDAEIYPYERRVEVRGKLHLVNKHDVPIDSLHVTSFDPQIEVAALEIPGATLEHHDEELGYRIYALASPMQPGAGLDITYHYRKHLRGFGNQTNDDSIVANGTFFNSFSYMPHFGYSDQLEISDPNDRRKHDLPERLRMPKIDDADARKNNYITSGSDWVDFAATVSTAADQIAVAPGYLIKEWTEGDRRFFRYEMDSPILNFWSILSARYEVRRDEWRPPGGGDPVAIEIFYHHVHDYNIDKMITSIKESLDTFTVEFSPYQHKQVRILEFPQYASFAQAFPNTIPYSESIGFIADASAEDIDTVFYVTSHEVAHQWWAHQVVGANVQGATLMSESLAQYSALMVMERHFGPNKLPKFLEYEMNGYLSARKSEAIEELPLLLVENQQYIHYQKASVVFYALHEYIGEAALNGALRDYIAQVGYQQPPYTISHELYDHLKRATPDKYRYLLEDMFEKITLYDNRALKATVTERDDGKFELTLELQVRKLYADGKGAETPAETLADWVEVGAYVEREDEDGEMVDEPIYLELHQFTEEETTVTLVLDERPVRAGVDPRKLLIDRSPRDNTREVEDPE